MLILCTLVQNNNINTNDNVGVYAQFYQQEQRSSILQQECQGVGALLQPVSKKNWILYTLSL